MKRLFNSGTTTIGFIMLFWICAVSIFHGCSCEDSSVDACGTSAFYGDDLKGWQLDENNTGLCGAGIDRFTLPLYEPPDEQLESGSWTVPTGTTITDRRIEVGSINMSAGNITFERCWFLPRSIGRGMPLVQGSAEQPNIISECDIDGSALDTTVYIGLGTSVAVSTSSITVERCNIHHFGSGVAFTGSGAVNLNGSYIHDLVDTEYSPGNWSHTDGFTIRGFDGTEAIIANNRINAFNGHCTGAVFLQATWDDSFFDNIRFNDNLLEGNGYNLVIERDNGVYGTNIRAVNNRFTIEGYGVGYIEHGPGWAQWQENYENDPAQTGNKGNLAAEPLTQPNDALVAPDDLQAVAASGGVINLSWSDNSADELGFKIMRSVDGTVFDSLTIVAADSVSYSDTGLTAGTTYYYKIAAVNDDGISDFSNVVNEEAQ